MVTTTRKTLVAAMLMVSGASWAELPTELYPQQVVEGEAVQLIIELGDAPGGQNDLTPLERDFRVLGRSQQSSTVMRNGTTTHSKKLTLTLAPKRSGVLEVPAFMLEGDLTEPRRLTVVKPSVKDQQALAEQVRIEGDIPVDEAYVQQPLVYTLRIELSAQLFDGAISAPEVVEGDAIIEELGEQKQFRSQRGNRLIQVVEQQYLITPQRSGPLRLSAAELSGKLPQGRPRDTVFGRQYSQFRQVNIRTESKAIDIKPVPASFKGQQWLPADRVTLTDDWQMDDLAVGQPITRTLTMKVIGLGASQLPELKLKVPAGVRQYPEEPAIDHDIEDGVLISTLTQQVTLIPTVSGAIEFPAIEVAWWNLNTDQPETARVDSTGLQITGDATAASGLTAPAPVLPAQPEPPQPEKSPVAAAVESDQPLSAPEPGTVAVQGTVVTPTLIGGGLAALLAAAGAGWLLGRRSGPARRAEPETLSPEVSVPDTNALRKACGQNDAAAARTALQAWCAQRWSGGNISQLVTLASPALKTELQRLNRALYAEQAEEGWQGAEMWQQFSAFVKQDSSGTKRRTNSELAPLNPGHKG